MQAEPPATTAPATTKAVPGGVQLDSAICPMNEIGLRAIANPPAENGIAHAVL